MRGEYNTKQKSELIRFLKEHPFEHFSAEDMTRSLRGDGIMIGQTTVYRYLEAMSEHGHVRKYQNAQGIVQYQYLEEDMDCSEHFHMMCSECGSLFHVDCGLFREMSAHLIASHGFELDPKATILVGRCASCRGEETHGDIHHGACHGCV